MKYSLDCYIKTNNNGIRNAVKQLIPDIEDGRVWGGEYSNVEIEDDDGIMIFVCRVRFNVKTDRSAVTSSVHGLEGVLMACENESYIREHKCYHHPDDPDLPCEVENIMRKKDGEIVWI